MIPDTRLTYNLEPEYELVMNLVIYQTYLFKPLNLLNLCFLLVNFQRRLVAYFEKLNLILGKSQQMANVKSKNTLIFRLK